MTSPQKKQNKKSKKKEQNPTAWKKLILKPHFNKYPKYTTTIKNVQEPVAPVVPVVPVVPVAPPLVRMQPVAPVVPLEEQAQVVPVVPKKPAGRNTVIIPQFSEILSRSATRSAKKASEAKGTTPVKRTKKATLDEFLLAPSNLFPSSGDSPVKLPAESQVELTDKQTLDLEAFLDAQLLADALKAKRLADARVQRLADKKAKKLEEEAQRIAVDEVEAEAQRIADARAQTLADARVKRQADLKAKKLVEEAQRIAVETEAQRLADPNAEKISPTKALRLQRQQQVDIIANISQNEKTNKTPKSPKPIPILFDATSTTQPESKPIPTLTTLQVRRNQLEALNKKLKQNATPYQNLNRMPQNKKLSEPIPESIPEPIPEPIPEIKAWWQIQHEKEMALIKAETELEEKEREIRKQEREKERETIKQKSLDAQRVRNEQIAQKESIQAKREEEKKEATLRIKERDARPPSRGRQSMSSTLPLESQLVVSTAKERTRSMSRDGIKSLELGPPRHISKKSKDGQSITNIFSKSAFSPDAEKITITQDPAGGYVVEPSLLSSLLDLDIPNDGKLKAEGRESLTDSERKKFMIQFKAYHKKNEDIKTIRQYKTYILKHNTKFASKTIHRANLYF